MQKRDLKKCKRINFAGRNLRLLLALFFIGTQLYAHSGLLSGEKKLRVSKTKWFDIIYPERCQESAALLYEKADQVYDEVTAQYGLTLAFRIPVVITPAVEQFNAFWSAIPYNHIAIYDTGCSGADELSVFSETLLSTFRHELTHAVTYNMKNGFWRFMGRVFGDCVAPGMLSVTTGMAEGATVTSESAGGEGRLNDEYAKHFVKQAKIEDEFPAYHDVSGSADIQPGGAPYYFNGAFHGWLQDKYGLEAYAEFWYRVVNGKNFTISGAFKKSFGIKLKKAWKQFIQDYEVPQVASNPVRAGLVQDFFEPSEDDYSRMNDAGSLFTSVSSAPTENGSERLVWIDRYGGRVFEKTAFDYQHIFSQQGLTGVCLSNDGRFLTVNYISNNAPAQTARVKIYDFERKSFYTVKEKGLKDSLILKKDGGYYLLSQKYFDQHYSIVVLKLLMSDTGRRITATQPYAEILFDVETNPYEFTALNNGTFAYLKKERMNYSLCISTAEGQLLQEFAFPQGMTVRSLAYSPKDEDSTFYISYAEKDSLPRAGRITLNADGASLTLTDSDISGGIFEPVLWKDKIVYIGEFFRQSRLLCIDEADLFDGEEDQSLVEVESAVKSEVESEELDEGQSEVQPSALQPLFHPSLLPAKSYNPFPYLVRGIFIPLSIYQSDYFGSNTLSDSVFDNFYLGTTYLTANPWTDGGSELFTLTGGYNIVSKTFGTALTINEGTATSLLSSQTQVKSEFDSNGWKQSGANLTLSTGFETGRVSSLSLSNTASALLGNQEELYLSLTDVVSAQFSTLRRAGPGRFEIAGFALAVSFGELYEAELSNASRAFVNASALAAALRICIPHLLPFESKYGFTYNLPFSINLKLLPSSSIYGYASMPAEEKKSEDENSENKRVNKKLELGLPVFDGSVELTAFSMEIQKAIPGITAIYLNDFYINLGYAASGTAGSASENGFQTAKIGEYFKAIADGRGYFLDSVYVKGALDFTPNIGVFAKPNFKLGVYAIYSYTLHSVRALKPAERVKISLGLNLNY